MRPILGLGRPEVLVDTHARFDPVDDGVGFTKGWTETLRIGAEGAQQVASGH